jgi:hypothetical protein
MKCKLILTLMLLVALILSGTTIAQAQATSSGDKVSSKQSRKRKVLLGPGYVLLPESYKAYRNKSGIDTWSGYIISSDGDFRIDVYGGMVGSPFGIDEDKFVWTKVEGVSKEAIKLGLKRVGAGDVMVAESVWINFTASVKHDVDKESFLEIVRSYRDEKCKDCEEMLSAPPSNNSFNRTRN